MDVAYALVQDVAVAKSCIADLRDLFAAALFVAGSGEEEPRESTSSLEERVRLLEKELLAERALREKQKLEAENQLRKNYGTIVNDFMEATEQLQQRDKELKYLLSGGTVVQAQAHLQAPPSDMQAQPHRFARVPVTQPNSPSSSMASHLPSPTSTAPTSRAPPHTSSEPIPNGRLASIKQHEETHWSSNSQRQQHEGAKHRDSNTQGTALHELREAAGGANPLFKNTASAARPHSSEVLAHSKRRQARIGKGLSAGVALPVDVSHLDLGQNVMLPSGVRAAPNSRGTEAAQQRRLPADAVVSAPVLESSDPRLAAVVQPAAVLASRDPRLAAVVQPADVLASRDPRLAPVVQPAAVLASSSADLAHPARCGSTIETGPQGHEGFSSQVGQSPLVPYVDQLGPAPTLTADDFKTGTAGYGVIPSSTPWLNRWART
eukprot:gene20043-26758_t